MILLGELLGEHVVVILWLLSNTHYGRGHQERERLGAKVTRLSHNGKRDASQKVAVRAAKRIYLHLGKIRRSMLNGFG